MSTQIDNQIDDPKVVIDRPCFDQELLDREFDYVPHQPFNCAEALKRQCYCSKERVVDTLFGFFPIMKWLPKYNIRRDFINDLIAGLTVGIMHIPEGMAYASLASVLPIYGLYTSFFPPIVYLFFGTSRHVSLGTSAVGSLMIGSVRLRLLPVEPEAYPSQPPGYNMTNDSNFTSFPAQFDMTPVELISSLTLAVGLCQLLMAVLRLDFLTAYLTDQVIGGFTTGAACHVFVAQLNKILGVKLPRHSGPGKLFKTCRDLIASLGDASWQTFVLSLATMAVLFIGKEFVNPLKKRFRVPIPWELVVVGVGTALSVSFGFQQNYSIKVVDHIATGFPVPELPRLDLIPRLLSDAVGIAIVVAVVTISMGKLFAKNHCYRIDAGQELYALSFMNCFSCLFQVLPVSISLSRCMVFEGAGARSQLGIIFSSVLLLIVLLWLAPLFQALPMCILGSIVIVALKGMFKQVKELGTLWHSIWLVACLSTVCLDVREGLAVSVIFALFTLVLRSQRPQSAILGALNNTGLFSDADRYSQVNQLSNVRIFRFDCSLLFSNTELFRKRLFKQTDVDPAEARQLPKNWNKSKNASPPYKNPISAVEESTNIGGKMVLRPENNPGYVILDCSGLNAVDYMGALTLKNVFDELDDVGVRLLFSHCKPRVRDVLEAFGLFHTVPKQLFFPSIQDAVARTSANRSSYAVIEGKEEEQDFIESHVASP